MKAITLHPEWAWAITRLGKNIENRTWRPYKSLSVGDRIAIHAGGRFGGATNEVFASVDVMARRAGWRVSVNASQDLVNAYSTRFPRTVSECLGMMPHGAVVAVATFAGFLSPQTHEQHGELKLDDECWPWWSRDHFGWILKDIDVLVFPVLCRGRQQLWNLPDEVERHVLEGVRSLVRKGGEVDKSSDNCGHNPLG